MKTTTMIRLLLVCLFCSLPAAAFAQYPDIAYYKFNEGAGTSISNSASPGSSIPNFESGMGGVWDTASPAVGGGAMNFNGQDRLVTNWATDVTNSFTIECWIRTNYDTTLQQPCGVGQAGFCTLGRLWGDYTSGMGFFRAYIGFYNDGANFLGGGLTPLNNTVNPVAASAVVSDGQWHHIALVFDQPNMTLTSYVDGILDQQAAGVAPGSAGTAARNFYLGGTEGVGSPFDGSVDEFRIWSTPRSQADIVANMSTEFSLPAQASFTANITSGGTPLLVSFSDASTTTDPGGITSRLWDFGDGNTSTDTNPCHLYTAMGSYTVSLSITTATGIMDTLTAPAYINTGAEEFYFQSCGQGDLYVSTPTPPAGWVDGFTLVSTTTAGPLGGGFFFGLYPDIVTWQGVTYPPTPGFPLHFVNVNNPNLYPDAPISFPNGTFPTLAGFSLDAVVVYRDGLGGFLGLTSVSRANF